MTNRRPATAIEATTQPDCVAVIDIGSNSLRLVVYDAPRRAARTLLNEKVMCGLGRGLEKTDRLNADGVALAKANLQRFIALARAAGASRIDVLATAAVRDAEDGAEFVNDIEKRFSIRVRVLPGAEEGRLSALGVLAGIPTASGVAGDLGGGSVELAALGNGRVGTVTTLPIGPLRLLEEAHDERELKDIIDRHLENASWLGRLDEPRFYAVGGAWRAIARIHMEQHNYPLHIIQGYTLQRGEAQSFLEIMARQSRKSLEKISTISRKRLEVVPLAARILSRILRRTGALELVFSAAGLREGHLYSLLGAEQQRADPLLAACTEEARANPRFGEDAEALVDWTGPLFPKEPANRLRLRRAAALLGDIAWHHHPDYRADLAMRHVLYMPVGGLDHPERVFLSAALATRYGNTATIESLAPLRLVDEEGREAARVIGLALRLAYTLTGGVPGLLRGSSLRLTDTKLVLNLMSDHALLLGEAVQRRLDALGRALGRPTEIRRA
ncbi:MAG TPA: Ppx/GppA family phosphatase [Stellaceae bacterium]|jgi:exopolyphosphatase/guanosine-5'-triphosphate,3'-diphosphate pyrophosphatase